MLVKVHTAAVQGLQAIPVVAEVNSARGINFYLVGLPDNAVKESYQRIVAAIQNSGYRFPVQNITVNLTALPVITFVNYLKTTSYTYEFDEETEDYQHIGDEVSKIWCYPMPNYIGSAAVGMTFGRIFFSSQFTYNWFYFRSNNAFKDDQIDIPYYVDDLKIKGSFHDWMLQGMVVYRF